MRIDPGAEQPARALLGHAIRGEREQYAAAAEDAGEARFLEILSLCLRVAGYVAIDVCGQRLADVAIPPGIMTAGGKLTAPPGSERLLSLQGS